MQVRSRPRDVEIKTPMSLAPSTTTVTRPEPSPSSSAHGFVERLRAMALRSLARMYSPDERLFVFRLRRAGETIVSEGLSPRYTAITLIGLSGEEPAAVAKVLGGSDVTSVYDRLLRDLDGMQSLGDVALTLWAGHALGIAAREQAVARLRVLHAAQEAQPTVELSWVVAALSLDQSADPQLRERAARRLLDSFRRDTFVFPHVVGGGREHAFASHVSCFADLVYPVQALSFHARATGAEESREAARSCAEYMCRMQGPAGQWWWHYDYRTGRVLERYPVYAVHQDAMAPMALFAAAAATGLSFDREVQRGLDWLEHSPELQQGTLIDDAADLIWRKVARREPAKLSRYAQALASRVHPSVRLPGSDLLFPPKAIDAEDRPYHLGWLLFAFPPKRAPQW